MVSAAQARVHRRRTFVILAALGATEAVPIVYALTGARVIGFWPLGRVLTQPASALGWLLAAAVAIGYAAFTASRNAGIAARLTQFGALKVVAIAMAVSSGITEEIVFRRILMDVLATHGVGALVQIAASGVVFGAVHVVWIGFAGPRRIGGIVGATTLLGLALAVVYIASGRSVVPCIIAHIAINAVLEPWLVLSAVERSWGRRSPRAPAAGV